jgi:acyl-homoserine-lactone acylase
MLQVISGAVLALLSWSVLAAAPLDELKRLNDEAQRVTIVRDDWGIPHVHGKSDADAVFGLIYAQAEDDFNRIEQNYLLSQGRLAEAEGEKEIWRDLRMRLFITPEDMRAKYAVSPDWLKRLTDAWADGLNYFLQTHPKVKPRVLKHFEPWMALTFTEGSIGGDIERISLDELASFYEQSQKPEQRPGAEEFALTEPSGSNGFAIAPARSASKHALLWINPHTSFFFRAEAQATSDEGLNAYGAITWGQFFIYQGFNERAGWMHTSSGVDNVDEYLERVTRRGDHYTYKYADSERPVLSNQVTVRYRTDAGMKQRVFTVYRTHHGPIVRKEGEQWVSVRLMQEPIKALMQSYLRTKAHTLDEYKDVMNLHANSSNNTVFADAQGDIAYFHANFIPKRDPNFDWSKPVDGTITATEWGEPEPFEAAPNVINPKGGWVFNTNDAPWTAAGGESPKQADYPAYVDLAGENPRGVHAARVLSANKSFTLDTVPAAAFDPQMPELEKLIPGLVEAYGNLPDGDPLREKLGNPVAAVRNWDIRWAADSVPTTLGVLWGDELWKRSAAGRNDRQIYDHIEHNMTDRERLEAFSAVVDRLTKDFGHWQVPWGDINRFQRLTSDIVQPFNDAGPSIAVPFTTGRWGSLASFGARTYNGSKKQYGTSGNSFLAIVEFGDKIRARAVTAGGESGDPKSPHFNDQAQRYASGKLREVYFYPEQLVGHTEASYQPGQARSVTNH